MWGDQSLQVPSESKPILVPVETTTSAISTCLSSSGESSWDEISLGQCSTGSSSLMWVKCTGFWTVKLLLKWWVACHVWSVNLKSPWGNTWPVGQLSLTCWSGTDRVCYKTPSVKGGIWTPEMSSGWGHWTRDKLEWSPSVVWWTCLPLSSTYYSE